MAEKKDVPFFAADLDKTKVGLNEFTEEEELQLVVQAEMNKTCIVSNLHNANGVGYAPWMGISADNEAKIRQLMKDKAVARCVCEEQDCSVNGNLYFDPQVQELYGTGLNYKVIDGQ
eukprot:9653905-Ditylum_brightwellii.AAC.1